MVDQGTGSVVVGQRNPQVRRPPNTAGIYDVLDLILDKGIVIDAFVRVSLVGIELVTVDARVVIASVDTYLRYAESAEQLQLYRRSESKKLPDMVGAGAKGKIAGKGAEAASKLMGGGDQDEDDENDEDRDDEKHGIAGKLVKGVGTAVGKLVHRVTGAGGDDDDDEGDERQSEQRRRPERSERQERSHRGNGSGKAAKSGSRR